MKSVSGRRMCRLLEERGWQLDRIKGSHHVYRHPATGRSSPVPVHGNSDLKPRPNEASCAKPASPQAISDLTNP
jgi:predicted RNA binding protein YcfA (HicA-like mRNA interferase family)